MCLMLFNKFLVIYWALYSQKNVLNRFKSLSAIVIEFMFELLLIRFWRACRRHCLHIFFASLGNRRVTIPRNP